MLNHKNWYLKLSFVFREVLKKDEHAPQEAVFSDTTKHLQKVRIRVEAEVDHRDSIARKTLEQTITYLRRSNPKFKSCTPPAAERGSERGGDHPDTDYRFFSLIEYELYPGKKALVRIESYPKWIGDEDALNKGRAVVVYFDDKFDYKIDSPSPFSILTSPGQIQDYIDTGLHWQMFFSRLPGLSQDDVRPSFEHPWYSKFSKNTQAGYRNFVIVDNLGVRKFWLEEKNPDHFGVEYKDWRDILSANNDPNRKLLRDITDHPSLKNFRTHGHFYIRPGDNIDDLTRPNDPPFLPVIKVYKDSSGKEMAIYGVFDTERTSSGEYIPNTLRFTATQPQPKR